ncbi:DUF6297 family protein [Arsenicicoccus sp. oral taxon 190]|uniref:DUF6297 family protein n=1 Tax=Arsenicicoccus sp. oral taxon 190 TaxID=1658671 RepID=UPI00067A2734|nr:DUF6297 family protein [Arsenicicoccus sp. oral taxon 190]AKT51156.1 hypothetical protein ADJ73_07210 [Arsenicicoccus sp. oral taxon 190]
MTSEAADYLALARRAHGQGEGRFVEIYMWVLALVLLGLIIGNGWGEVVAAARCTGTGCVPGAAGGWSATALALLLAAGIARLAVAFGPVGADPAKLTWLLSGPLSRRPVLRPRVWGMALGAAFLGALCGPTVLATAGLALTPDAVAWGVPGGAVVALVLTAVVAVAQAEAGWRRRVALAPRALATVGVVSALLATLLGGGGALHLDAGGALHLAAGGVTALVAGLLLLTACAVGGLLAADRRIDRIDGAELRRAGESTSAAYQSALMMDPSAVSHRSVRDRLGRRGRTRSRRGRGRGAAALLQRDLLRIGRQGDRLLVGIPLLVGGLLLAHLAPPVVCLPALGLAAARLARSVGDGLTSWTQSTGLRRSLPLPDAVVRTVYLIGPGLVALVWATLAAVLIGVGGWVALALVAAALASLLAGARPTDLSLMSVMVPTPFGMVPLGTLGALRGYGLAPMALVVPALVPGAAGVAVPLVVLAWQWGRTARP